MNKSEKLWDRMSKIYDKTTKKFDQLNIKVVENTKKYLNVNDIVLECGCGTGTISIEIANKVKEIYAIDISSKMLDIAKRKTDENKIENIHFLQSTIFDERYKIGSFDVILAFNVLHYFENIQKHMKRINELLKPEGMFISVTPCSIEKKTFLSFIFSIFISFIVKIGILPYIKFFRFSDLDELMTDGSFQIVETTKLHGPEEHYFIIAKKEQETVVNAQ